MSRTRIVKGNITKIIGGNYKRYSKDDIVNIGSKVIQVGKEGGVTYGEPEEVPKTIANYPHPIFKGHVIFCNGYHSSPIENTESYYNVIMRKDPDSKTSGAMQGENVKEHEYTDPEDILTNDEIEELQNRSRIKKWLQDKVSTTYPIIIFTPFGPFVGKYRFKYPILEKFYGYWNNSNNVSKKLFHTEFAGYFNAQGNIHYINGSHGLRSSGDHRINHGIAQGYAWAKNKWGIREKDKVQKELDKGNKGAETYSPNYKPITIVGHSQGAAMAAGVAVGIIAYAQEKGWEEMPINLLFLGTHQPQGLTGEDYKNFLKANSEDIIQDWILEDIAKLFTDRVFEKEQGIDERMAELLGGSNWGGLKDHAVQFTFPNDRALLVTRMGDIPGVKNACSDIDDFGHLGWQYLSGKENKDSEHDVKGIDGYAFPKRLLNKKFKDNGEVDYDEPTYKEVVKDYWQSIIEYRRLKNEIAQNPSSRWSTIPLPPLPIPAIVPFWLKEILEFYLLKALNDRLLRQKIICFIKFFHKHDMELQAHFAPVGLMFNDKVLSDWDQYQDQTIWDRIQEVSKEVFYRIDTRSNSKDRTSSDYKRVNEKYKTKEEIEGKIDNIDKKISTSIVNNPKVKEWVNIAKQEIEDRINAAIEKERKEKEAKKRKFEREWEKATNPQMDRPKY